MKTLKLKVWGRGLRKDTVIDFYDESSLEVRGFWLRKQGRDRPYLLTLKPYPKRKVTK